MDECNRADVRNGRRLPEDEDEGFDVKRIAFERDPAGVSLTHAIECWTGGRFEMGYDVVERRSTAASGRSGWSLLQGSTGRYARASSMWRRRSQACRRARSGWISSLRRGSGSVPTRIHINCFDARVLRDAMEHPERYADLPDTYLGQQGQDEERGDARLKTVRPPTRYL